MHRAETKHYRFECGWKAGTGRLNGEEKTKCAQKALALRGNLMEGEIVDEKASLRP